MRHFLLRQKYLIDFTLASLLRRKGKNGGLLIVYVIMVFVLASVMLFAHALRSEAGLVLRDAPQIIVQRLVAGRHDLITHGHLERIAGIRGVVTQYGRLWGYYYDPAVRANYTLLVPPDSDQAPLEGTVRVGATLAAQRGVAPGDYLTFRGTDGRAYPLRITGLLDADSALINADLVLLDEATFRNLMGVPSGQYVDLVLRVRNPREVRTIAEKIVKTLPDTRPILREEILRTYDAVFNWRQGLIFVLLSGAVLAFGIFVWDKASGLSAEERREIGILKAVGWETSDILHMKLWEGGVISLTAFFTGFLLAYLHVFYGGAALFEPVLKGWAVLYPDFRPIPFVDGLQVATLFFFTVFPYTLATLVPIWRAAIMDPDAVMR